eukprot:6694705-Alexandrium_andersonii.AAC.1
MEAQVSSVPQPVWPVQALVQGASGARQASKERARPLHGGIARSHQGGDRDALRQQSGGGSL